METGFATSTVGRTLRIVEISPNAAILDAAFGEIQDALDEPWLNHILDGLVVQLREMRARWPPAKWARFVADCRRHPLAEILREDPFTRRVSDKPRGYAVDPRALDFLYHHPSVESELHSATETGFLIAQYTTTQSAAARSIRHRRRVLAQAIDKAAAASSRPHVLSVGCGHLREAQLCAAVRDGAIGRFVAVDPDDGSIAVVQDELGHCVEAVTASVRAILEGAVYGRFHLVYAAGLFDTLPEPIARRLASVLFGYLRPGGVLLLTNFLPTTRESGYMDAVLGWTPAYRSCDELLSLAGALPRGKVAIRRSFEDSAGTMGYLEVTRAP